MLNLFINIRILIKKNRNKFIAIPVLKIRGSSGFLVGTDFNILCNVTRIRKRYF